MREQNNMMLFTDERKASDAVTGIINTVSKRELRLQFVTDDKDAKDYTQTDATKEIIEAARTLSEERQATWANDFAEATREWQEQISAYDSEWGGSW